MLTCAQGFKFTGLISRSQTSFPGRPTTQSPGPRPAFSAQTPWAPGPKAKLTFPAEGDLGKVGGGWAF